MIVTIKQNHLNFEFNGKKEKLPIFSLKRDKKYKGKREIKFYMDNSLNFWNFFYSKIKLEIINNKVIWNDCHFEII